MSRAIRTPSTATLVWFRRDLRVHDHPPLHAALAASERERTLAAYPGARRGKSLRAPRIG